MFWKARETLVKHTDSPDKSCLSMQFPFLNQFTTDAILNQSPQLDKNNQTYEFVYRL